MQSTQNRGLRILHFGIKAMILSTLEVQGAAPGTGMGNVLNLEVVQTWCGNVWDVLQPDQGELEPERL